MPSDRSAHWLSEVLQSRVATLLSYAEQIQVPLLTLAYSWLLSHPEVSSVIAGASTPEQIQSNAAAPISLDDSVIAKLNELTA
jgi:aryl-alcohol dehydrogenase-like predicted oxidoreductase